MVCSWAIEVNEGGVGDGVVDAAARGVGGVEGGENMEREASKVLGYGWCLASGEGAASWWLLCAVRD